MCQEQLFVFEPVAESGQARLSLDPTVRSEHPVNPLLYGKFCEHLGRNIYQGMEAQILYNPTFFSERNVPDAAAAQMAERLGWPSAEPVAEAMRDGGAIGWLRLGGKDRVLLSPDAGPHGSPAQRVETSGRGEGIGQWTHLPLHRTRGYEFRLVGRAVRPCRAHLSLAAVGPDGRAAQVLARATAELAPEWATITGRLDVPADDRAPEDGLFLMSVTTDAAANVVLDRLLLYPDDHVDHADPEILRMLADARLPVLRWPGGNFASGYHWRDGVGPVDARPTYANPVWRGTLESGLFGTDEFIAYCRNVGCEPLICVNAGNGTPAEAAAWVEYCNGPADSPMGRLRASNGRTEPYGVRYWEIGNEIFGRHQIGWTTPRGNVDRYLRFAEAMRAADPSIRLLACGGLHLGVDAEWNRRLNNETGGSADCQTHHILEGGSVDETVDPKELFGAFMGYPIRIGQDYRLMRQRMVSAGIRRPRLAITELQLFAHLETKAARPPGDVRLPTPSTISEALYASLIIHECIRLGDFVEMITHSATVNHGGGLRKARQRVWANPVHYAHVMGVDLAGGTPIAVKLACGSFSTSREFGHLPVVAGCPDLDALAVLAEDGDALLVMLVHRSAHAGAIELSIDLGGFAARPQAEVLTLSGRSLDEENTLQEPERIVPRASTAAVENGSLRLTVPPYSLTRIRLRRGPGRG